MKFWVSDIVVARQPAFQNAPPDVSCHSASRLTTRSNELLMAIDDHYDVCGLAEAQYVPGSHGQVLKNLLGITSKRDMDEAEARAQERGMDTLVRTQDATHRFTAADVCECHRTWLGKIYEWAGHYRQVNVVKDGFPFTAVAQVPASMDQFERDLFQH